RLSLQTSVQLQKLSREHKVTMNTIVQGAWALLLSRYSGEEDVVFGATVSGRPANLAGVEQMLGLFINTLPVRVKIEREKELVEWLKEVQSRQVQTQQYEYSPLVDVQGWSEVERGIGVFESILVFENYPVEKAVREGSIGEEEAEDIYIYEKTNYPMTVV